MPFEEFENGGFQFQLINVTSFVLVLWCETVTVNVNVDVGGVSVRDSIKYFKTHKFKTTTGDWATGTGLDGMEENRVFVVTFGQPLADSSSPLPVRVVV